MEVDVPYPASKHDHDFRLMVAALAKVAGIRPGAGRTTVTIRLDDLLAADQLRYVVKRHETEFGAYVLTVGT